MRRIGRGDALEGNHGRSVLAGGVGVVRCGQRLCRKRQRRPALMVCAADGGASRGSPATATATAAAAAAGAPGELKQMLIQGSSGAVSGVMNTLILSPLDVVKTRLQTQGAGGMRARYNGVAHALRTMLREEGLRSYYHGVSASLCAFVPNWAIYWATYEMCKRRYTRATVSFDVVSRHYLVHKAMVEVMSAITAGAVTALSTSPLWVMKARLQSDYALGSARRYRSLSHGLLTIVREEGFGGLYKGLVPSLLGVGHVAVQFPLYEHIIYRQTGGDDSKKTAQGVGVASAVSKLVASAFFYPHEVLRTRFQVDRRALAGREMTRMFRLAGDIIRKDGYFKGLYRGFGTNLMRTIPSNVITFQTYEFAKRYWQERDAENRARNIAKKEKEGSQQT